MRRVWEKWGYLAVLGACLALILGVALLSPKEETAKTPPTITPVRTMPPTETPSPSPLDETEEKREEFSLGFPAEGESLREYAADELNYDPMSGEYSAHDGVDFAGNEGDAVRCAADGIVEKVWDSEKYGWCVEIAHRGGYFTRYGSLGDVTVKEGDRIKKGQVIGDMGACLWEDFPHLHFSLRRLSQNLDPMLYIKNSA